MKSYDQKGQSLTEYMTLLVLVSLVAVGAAQGLGKQIKKKIKTAREVISREINFKDLR